MEIIRCLKRYLAREVYRTLRAACMNAEGFAVYRSIRGHSASGL